MPTDQIMSAGLAMVGRATLLDDTGPLKAWVERVVRKDPDLRWIVGNYVEANVANDNGHIFPLEDLRTAQHTVAGKPLNMMHRDHYIVGSYAGAQLMANGKELTASDGPDGECPYVEAVAGMWHTRFPEEYFNIQRAHKDGSLFFSMEAVPEEVSCPDCAHRVVFAGTDSDTYCAHMRGATGPKILHNPIFAGGAIIIPPARPGWSRADVKEISASLEKYNENASLYPGIVAQAPHLDQSAVEQLMAQVMIMSREFSQQKRENLAKQGSAMPDGSFPIANAKDLKNAIKAVGRAKNPAAAKAHIRKRAKALGLTDLLPEGW